MPIQRGQVEFSARLLADPCIYSGVVRPIKPDWTVDWVGVTGPRLIRATRLPAGWWMKAVLCGDREVTDEIIELTHGQTVMDLTVVLDNRPTEIAGAARDAKGAVASARRVPAGRGGVRRTGSVAQSGVSRVAAITCAASVTFEAGQKIDIELSLIGG